MDYKKTFLIGHEISIARITKMETQFTPIKRLKKLVDVSYDWGLVPFWWRYELHSNQIDPKQRAQNSAKGLSFLSWKGDQ